MKNKLGVISSQYITLKGNKFLIQKEDDQAFNDAIYLSVNLLYNRINWDNSCKMLQKAVKKV